MENLVKKLCIALSLVVLTACGGGGGESEPVPNDDINDSVVSKEFSVMLKNVDIHRVSNDEEVLVDITSINSGQLRHVE